MRIARNIKHCLVIRRHPWNITRYVSPLPNRILLHLPYVEDLKFSGFFQPGSMWTDSPRLSGLVMQEPCGKGDMLSLLILGPSVFVQDLHPSHKPTNVPSCGKENWGPFHVTHSYSSLPKEHLQDQLSAAQANNRRFGGIPHTVSAL